MHTLPKTDDMNARQSQTMIMANLSLHLTELSDHMIQETRFQTIPITLTPPSTRTRWLAALSYDWASAAWTRQMGAKCAKTAQTDSVWTQPDSLSCPGWVKVNTLWGQCESEAHINTKRPRKVVPELQAHSHELTKANWQRLGWGCSSVGRASGWHAADKGSIPWCGKGLPPRANFQCRLSYGVCTPPVQSQAFTSMCMFKIL